MLSIEMKLLVEILLAIFLHPIIFILCWINILSRSDLSGLKKLLWILITVLWGIGPILYLLLADGAFW
jgi:phospholipase D-like protein